MTDLLTRAQLDVLALTLDTEPANIADLAGLGADSLRVLREHICDALFAADAAVFARVAKLAPLVPDSVVIKLAPAVLPAEVSGRAGGALGLAHPGRVAGILAGLPAGYLADAAPHMDPRTVALLAPRLSGEYLMPAAVELLRRGDYLTAARFMEHATDSLIDDFEAGIADNVGLLRTAALMTDSGRLRAMIDRLPATRRTAILRTAASDTDTTLVTGLSVLARLDHTLCGELATVLFDALGDEGLRTLVSVAAAHDAVAELLTLAAAVSDPLRRRLAQAAMATTDATADQDALATLSDALTDLCAP